MKNKTLFQKLHFFANYSITILLCAVWIFLSPLQAEQNDISNKNYRNRVLQKVSDLIETKYVLADKAKKHAHEFKVNYKNNYPGPYSNPKEFANQVTSDLIKITKDKHISFRLKEAGHSTEKSESTLRHPLRYHRLGINENKGFNKLEWLEGNIGYLELRRFYLFSDVRERVTAAIKFLSNANAIIIDLRENGGGSGDYLSSYFLKYPTQQSSCYYREDDFLREFWTSNNIGMEPLVDVPLFLLTGKETFSSAESFVYDMKVQKRALIVGDSTKGGAHSVDLFQIDEQFEIYIPTARAINPFTGTNWEGIGVIPDVMVAENTALDTALVLARAAGAKYAQKKEAQARLAIEKMQILIQRTENLFREELTAQATSALDSFFQAAEKFDFINEFFIDVLAYNYQSGTDQPLLYAILKKKIELFPQSPSAYESLAFAYYNNKDKDRAITQFRKVLELDPANRNALKLIKQLENR